MSADKRFHERIDRIQKGKTWTPDGVVQPRQARNRRTARAGGGAGSTILMLLAVPVALYVAGPETLPAPVLGFFTAPTTEAAMASLDTWQPLATLGR